MSLIGLLLGENATSVLLHAPASFGFAFQIAVKWHANPASSGSPSLDSITIVLSSLIDVPVDDQLLLPVASVRSSTIMNFACCRPAGLPPPATNRTGTPAAASRVATVSGVFWPLSI